MPTLSCTRWPEAVIFLYVSVSLIAKIGSVRTEPSHGRQLALTAEGHIQNFSSNVTEVTGVPAYADILEKLQVEFKIPKMDLAAEIERFVSYHSVNRTKPPERKPQLPIGPNDPLPMPENDVRFPDECYNKCIYGKRKMARPKDPERWVCCVICDWSTERTYRYQLGEYWSVQGEGGIGTLSADAWALMAALAQKPHDKLTYTVYHCMSTRPHDAEKYAVGSEETFNYFFSTSASKKWAYRRTLEKSAYRQGVRSWRDFDRDRKKVFADGTIYTIKLAQKTRARKLAPYAEFADEQEFLFPPGCVFQITAVKKEADQPLKIYMVEAGFGDERIPEGLRRTFSTDSIKITEDEILNVDDDEDNDD